jgi:UPF0271 protein
MTTMTQDERAWVASAESADAPAVQLDLNCDAGESFGPWPMGDDDQLLPLMTSVNIACGAHAGDPLVMRRTLELAARHNIAAGAHPGYPDLQGFGRRALALPPPEVEVWLLAQLGALAGVARALGVRLRHVKPHGALYNTAADDEALATAIAHAVQTYDPELVLVARAGSLQAKVARAAGLRVAEEAFADRGYDAQGHLLPRGTPGASITSASQAARRAIDLVRSGDLEAADGSRLALRPDTLCIHSDTAGASALARAVRSALDEAGVQLRPLYLLAH